MMIQVTLVETNETLYLNSEQIIAIQAWPGDDEYNGNAYVTLSGPIRIDIDGEIYRTSLLLDIEVDLLLRALSGSTT